MSSLPAATFFCLRRKEPDVSRNFPSSRRMNLLSYHKKDEPANCNSSPAIRRMSTQPEEMLVPTMRRMSPANCFSSSVLGRIACQYFGFYYEKGELSNLANSPAIRFKIRRMTHSLRKRWFLP